MQELIHGYLQNDLGYQVEKLHQFTDGFAAQYKSRHCVSDLSCSLADFGYHTQRSYFETSHAKGEQDLAGSHVKQRASQVVYKERPGSQIQRACTSILSRILLFQWHPALTHEQSQWNLNVGFSFLSLVREKGLWVETDLGGNLSQCQRLENGTVFRACHNKRRSSPDITLVTALIAY